VGIRLRDLVPTGVYVTIFTRGEKGYVFNGRSWDDG
jgi:hypothetical protein